MNCSIITKDNSYIYNDKMLEEYLTENLGIDIEDIENILCQEKDSYIQILQDTGEEYELLYDGACNNAKCACDELKEIADKLNSGKGLTKAEAARKINNLIKDYFYWL